MRVRGLRLRAGAVLVLTGIGAVCLLGEHGVRLGAWTLPHWSWGWNAWAALAAWWLLREDRAKPATPSLVALVSLVAFLVVRDVDFRAAADRRLPVSISVGSGAFAESSTASILFESRRELNRIAGRRRDVQMRGSLWLHPPRAGEYRLRLACDDRCSWTLGPDPSSGLTERVIGAGSHELNLPAIPIPLRIHYEQTSGPAHHRAEWNGPAWVEPSALDALISATRQRPDRTSAWIRLLLMLAAWAVGVASLLIWPRSSMVSERVSLVATLILVIAAASLFRIAALGFHADYPPSSPLGRLSERMGPWLPATVPASDDPYRADVRSYLDAVSKQKNDGFYSPSFREPFYPFIVRPFVHLWGELGILIQSVFMSVACLALFAMITTRLFSLRWALLLTIPIAFQEWLIREAPSGYRLGAYGFGILCVLGTMFVWTGSRPLRRWGLVDGLVAALVSLIRLSAITAIVPLLVLRVWQADSKDRLWYAIGFTGVWLALVGPFLWSNATAFGDPLYSISFHTEFWMRAEGLGDSNGPVSLPRYLLRNDRLGEFLVGNLHGLSWLPVRTFFRGLARFPWVSALVVGLGLVGLVSATLTGLRLGDRRWLFLPVAYLGQLFPFAYIQNFPSGEMPRFVMPGYFMLVLAVPLGVRYASRAWGHWRRENPTQDGAPDEIENSRTRDPNQARKDQT